MNSMREDFEHELVKRIQARTSFMKWRPNYEEWVQKRLWQERYCEPVLENLKHYVPDWKQTTILDLGSGMGGLVVRLQREGCKVLGLDYCFDYCIITKLRGMRYGLQPNVINGVAERIPLKDQSVDVVFCYEVIEHVLDPVAVLREIRRVIRPGGLVFITVPNRRIEYSKFRELMLLKRLRLLRLMYRLYRFTLMDGWHFILKPTGGSV